MIQTDLYERLDGIFLPLFTPFTFAGESVNEEQLRVNVRYYISRGIRILNPAGTTGEFWTLSSREHRQVLRATIEEAQAVCPEAIVIAGATGGNLAQTIKLARHAEGLGAAAVLIAPNYYLPMGEDDVVSYYRAISASVEVPIMIYEMPAATGIHLHGDVLARICDECENAVALKTALLVDSPREFERLIERFGERLRIFSGTGLYFAPFSYMTGVAGITDTLANAVPEFGLDLHELARAGRWGEMNELYKGAFNVLEIEQVYGRSGLKEIANLCGRNVGPTRYPMTSTLTPEDRADIERRLSEWPPTRDLLSKEPRVAVV